MFIHSNIAIFSKQISQVKPLNSCAEALSFFIDIDYIIKTKHTGLQQTSKLVFVVLKIAKIN